MALKGFELTMALGCMTPKEIIAWQSSRDAALDDLNEQIDKAQDDSYDALTSTKSTVDVPCLETDMKNVKDANERYQKACQPPPVALHRWEQQQKLFAQQTAEFKRKYLSSPQYAKRREYAAQWRKKNNIKGNGW